MKTILKHAGLYILMLSPVAVAQPQIVSILNAASYIPTGLPNSAIGQGSMFVVFGTGLGPAELEQAGGFPLPINLAGTSIRVTVDAAVVDAIIVYTSATQVAAILPSGTPVGIGLLSVTYAGRASQSGAFRIVRSAPGILTQNQAGTGPALAENFDSETDQPRNTLTRAAHPGQVVTLYGTGFGPIAGGDDATPVLQNLNIDLRVLVGGKPANVRYKGPAGCCAGIGQVVFEIPAAVEGCYVPVTLRVGDFVSNFATLSVAATGNICSGMIGVSGTNLEKLQAGGSMAFGSIVLHLDRGCSDDDYFCTAPTLTESGTAEFFSSGLTQLSFRVPLTLPSPGSCLVSAGRGTSAPPVGSLQLTPLDAGSILNLSGPKGTMQVPLQSPGRYSQQFSSGASQIQYLSPGSYLVDNGAGGADIGPFHATLNIPNPFSSAVERTPVGAKVTWSGGDPTGYVTVQGSAVSSTNRASASFVCTELVSAGQFTVPPEVLLSLPLDSGNATTISIGASSPVRLSFKGPGLDFAQMSYITSIP